MRLKQFIFLSGLTALLAVPARADLVLALTPGVQSGVGSNEVFFTGSFTNTSLTNNILLNNVQFSFTNQAGNYLAADSNAFYGNVPGILAPGGTYSDVVFGVAINSNTPPGQYSGTVTVQGGIDIFGVTNQTSQAFTVSLPAPGLGIALSGTNLVISWPSPPGSSTLQQNADLTTTNWTAATNVPALGYGQAQVILGPTNGSQFYRLVYP